MFKIGKSKLEESCAKARAQILQQQPEVSGVTADTLHLQSQTQLRASENLRMLFLL